jgi:hypothetical protein
VLGGISIVLLAAFFARQARIANPLMPLRLFRSRNVAGANLVQALLVVGMFGMFFLGALYMQRILRYDPLQVGLAFLPATLVMGTMSFRYSARLNMRFGPKATLLPSVVCIGLGMLLFARTPVNGSYLTDILPAMILFGFGAGLGFPSLMTLAMSGATQRDSGLASGLVNTSVESKAAALNSGYHLAYLIGVALVVVAFVVSATVLRSPAPAAAEQEEGAREQGGGEPAYSEAA